jgi:general secretion pathway protein C
MIKSAGVTSPYRVGDKVSGLGQIQRVGWRLVLVKGEGGGDCLLDLYPPPPGAEGEKVASAASPNVGRGPAPAAGRGQLPAELQKQIDEGIEVVSANERNVDRGLVESLIENSSSLMSQARILPYERDGEVQGFKLYGIRRDSLLGKLGLRNGDIVNNIGGVDMTSPDQALMAYTKLRGASNLSVTFTRRGQRQTMDFNIR